MESENNEPQGFGPNQYLRELKVKYIKNLDEEQARELDWIEFFLYLWFNLKLKKTKINRIIEKLRLQCNKGPEDFSGIIRKISPFTCLLDNFPYDKLLSKQELFQGLDDSEINRVYKLHLPDKN